MRYSVQLTDDAARDLDEIYHYIDRHDVPGKADYTLGRIEKVLVSLAETPDRGVHPGELLALGVREYREVFFKPYRIKYRVIGDSVFVLLIVDGRRDMQPLLERRLLEAK